MNINQRCIVAALLAVIGFATVHAEIATNLLQDAGFEGLLSGEPTSSSSPWGDFVDTEDPAAEPHIQLNTYQHHSGAGSLGFHHYNRTGYLYQTLGVQVEANTSYELSFWMLLATPSSDPTHTAASTINATLASSATEGGTYSWTGLANKDTAPTVAGEWQQFVFEFDSNDLTGFVGQWLEVRFVKQNKPSEYRIFLDDTAFGEVVPEPATVGMFGSTFALLLMYRRIFN